MEKKVNLIFKEKIKEKVIDIKDVSRGYDQIVKIVKTEHYKYVIKFPQKWRGAQIFREKFACDKLQGLIPLPKVIATGKNYLIESYIEGTDFDKAKLSISQKRKIFQELGKYLTKIHSINMKGFGLVNSKGEGEFKNLRYLLDDIIKNNLAPIKKVLSDKEYNSLLKYLNKNKHYAQETESVLLHFDFEDWNIKVKNSKISGIIDFTDLSAGPRAYDLARPFISHYKDKMFKYLLEGYGNIDLNKVAYYAIINLLWMIPFFIKEKRTEEVKNKIKLFKQLILETPLNNLIN